MCRSVTAVAAPSLPGASLKPMKATGLHPVFTQVSAKAVEMGG